MQCPQCQHPLSPPVGGRRLACAFCGWVQTPQLPTADEASPTQEPPARKAEEIARQRQLDTEPVWRYLLLVLGLLTLIVVGSNLMVSGFKNAQPLRKSPSPSLASAPASMPAFVPPSMLSANPGPANNTVPGNSTSATPVSGTPAPGTITASGTTSPFGTAEPGPSASTGQPGVQISASGLASGSPTLSPTPSGQITGTPSP
ncbi:MAG: hypothetical protein ACAI44_09715 [Candidatus Sericytochromatia bacterium]